MTTNSLKYLMAALLAPAAASGLAQASAIVYYQLEGSGVASSASGAIVDSSGNSRNATAGTFGGAPAAYVPSYSNVTVGAQIKDGISGQTVNSNNSSSMRFVNPGVASGNYATNSGGQIKLADSAALRPASFTVEAFIRVDNSIAYASFVGKERNVAGGSTWLLDSNPNGNYVSPTEPTNMTLRGRADHQATGSATADGFNQNFASTGSVIDTTSGPDMAAGWHHIAMTYDDSTNTFQLFVDYVNVTIGAGTLSTPAGSAGDLVYDAGNFVFGGGGGGRGFDGWMDEVRLSDSVLTPSQFLHVATIPEPSALMLLLGGMVGLFAVRRR